MSHRIALSTKTPAPARNNAARSGRKFVTLGKRARISSATLRGPYLPPERWYEPCEQVAGQFLVVLGPAGHGYCHVVTRDGVVRRFLQSAEWCRKVVPWGRLSVRTVA